MYKWGYDEETQQITIVKDGYKGKVFIGLVEGNVLRKIARHFRTVLKNMSQNIDEFIGTISRLLLFSNAKIDKKRIVFSTF